MNFALSFNKKYLNYAIVTITSICESNGGHHDVYILHSELDNQDIFFISNSLYKYDVSIKALKIDFNRYKDALPTSDYWSHEIYYRLFLPEILPDNVDRILYLDTDIIVHNNIDDLYNIDFEEADICACYDSNDQLDYSALSDIQQQMFEPLIAQGFKYFNSGVLLMNINSMKNKYRFETYLSAMKEWNNKMTAPDQDILNYIHHAKVKYISWRKYDLFAKLAYNSGWSYENVIQENCIIHFAGNKPWDCKNIHYSIEKLWWEYAEKTSVYKELMEGFLESALTDSFIEQEAMRLYAEKDQLNRALEEAKGILDKLGIRMEETDKT